MIRARTALACALVLSLIAVQPALPADSGTTSAPADSGTAAVPAVVHDTVWIQAPPAAPVPAAPKRERRHPHFKSDIWLPLPSVLLPGFGQYFQGDWTGAVYTGVAVGGFLLYASGEAELRDEGSDSRSDANPSRATESWATRRVILGALAVQGSGFMSAYSAFRSSVPRFQAEDGKYAFLTAHESIGDLMASPARFDHLLKPSSFIPLGLLGGAAAYLAVDYRGSHRGSDWTFSPDDLLFSWPLAYNAGLTEEAAFRGWLLPVAYQYTGERWWLANGAQALLFGAAHYSSDNPYPWPQALLGYYFGYLAHKNGWSLSESVFVHSWWDAILFTAQFATMRRVRTGSTAFRFDLPLPF
ncbi:MAG TPA: CPBP family intramembrane glutamic endopeptidase [Fibrobacteria bacterium]|nr:CPBP family intramembrane glutamic endopeptidase [Fibrobacteria bacterium]